MGRAVALALLLALAITSVVIGVALVCVPAAYITGGVLGAGWAVLLLAEAKA